MVLAILILSALSMIALVVLILIGRVSQGRDAGQGEQLWK